MRYDNKYVCIRPSTRTWNKEPSYPPAKVQHSDLTLSPGLNHPPSKTSKRRDTRYVRLGFPLSTVGIEPYPCRVNGHVAGCGTMWFAWPNTVTHFYLGPYHSAFPAYLQLSCMNDVGRYIQIDSVSMSPKLIPWTGSSLWKANFQLSRTSTRRVPRTANSESVRWWRVGKYRSTLNSEWIKVLNSSLSSLWQSYHPRVYPNTNWGTHWLGGRVPFSIIANALSLTKWDLINYVNSYILHTLFVKITQYFAAY